MRHPGYVVYLPLTRLPPRIYAVGDTRAEARALAREWGPDVKVAPATERLLDVLDRKGEASMILVDGVADLA